MDVEVLRSFIAVCESRSFTAAAQKVGRTQSAVSLQMRRIEDQIRRPLFVRGKVPVELTAHGEKFAAHARRIVVAYDEAMAAFDQKSVAGTVMLGMPGDYAPRILPLVLERFVSIYPAAQVGIIIEESKSLVRQLAEGSVDLAFITEGQGPTQSEQVAFRERVVWAGSSQVDAHLNDPLPIAIWGEGGTYYEWMQEALGQLGRPYRIAVTSPSLTGIKAAVLSGLAVTLMTECGLGPGMRELGEADGFPPMPTLSIRLEWAHMRKSPVVDRLHQHLLEAFDAGRD